MQTDLHAGTGALEWVVAGYGLTFATLLITAGRLGDQFGRRRHVLARPRRCSRSPRRPAAWPRARLRSSSRGSLQGVAAALLSPQVLSIIGVAYTGADRVRALSVYGIVLGLAARRRPADRRRARPGRRRRPRLAQLLPDQRPGRARRARARARASCPSRAPSARAGSTSPARCCVTAGLTAIVLPLVEGRQHGWPLWTWLCLGAAPVAARRVRRPPAPAGPPRRRAAARPGAVPRPRLQRRAADAARVLVPARRRSSSCSRCTCSSGRGLDALQAGLVFTILAVAYLVASMQAPALAARSGAGCRPLGALALGGRPRAARSPVADVGAGGSVAALAPACCSSAPAWASSSRR